MALPLTGNAQRLSRNYHDTSLSKVLIDLDRASSHYHISFIYNELEDFTVTKQFDDRPVVDALLEVLVFLDIYFHIG